MYAVMGITGNVGGAVARTLLQQGHKVRGIVRDPAKAQAWRENGAELVTADYDHHLIDAFTGVEGIFAMIPPNMAPEPGFPDSVARIAAIKAAVLAARPPRAVFLSSIGSEKDAGLGLITTTHILEQELGNTGIPTVFLRPGSFMENILYSIPTARATGKYFAFYQPLDQPFPLVATQDIGRVAAETLTRPWQGKRILYIAGPAFYSSNDVAAALTESLGQPIAAVPVPRETWPDVLAQIGIPKDRSGPYIEMLDGVNSRWVDFHDPAAEHIKGTTDLATAVSSLVGRSH